MSGCDMTLAADDSLERKQRTPENCADPQLLRLFSGQLLAMMGSFIDGDRQVHSQNL
jgi:hypothetical protein